MANQAIAASSARPLRPVWTLPKRLLVTRRGVQIALGCIWLLDGLLQFQSYMYTHAFLREVIEPTAKGQPGFISGPILTLAHFYGHNLTLWNTLSAEIQCAIGLGLILSRRTVRPALAVSFLWALVVWWLGEGFGTLLSGAPVSPLMGAPGAVFVYAMIGLLVWPKDDNPDGAPVDGGLLGRRGGRVVWSLIWVEAAALWLLRVDRTKEALKAQISGMADAAPHWLASVQHSLANGLGGDGVTVATVLAIASLLIAAGVWTRLRPAALVVGAALSLAYWLYGQSLGGPFWIGQATDVNTGPLLVLLAAALVPVAPFAAQATAEREQVQSSAVAVGA
ncbi:MAG TPA: hypothetical protein VNV37_08995 [Solirubrobacteraceae bacterium]|jgi:hypothetical protein|nr:hypothetical protein [Solirubrobacteraceae bacterium]